MNTKTLAFILGMALISPSTAAGDDAGGAALQFLNIGVSARDAGTGGALSALSDGPVSSYYNPAGLSGVRNFQIAGMHSEWFQDMRYEYLGLAIPAGHKAAIGMSLSYLGYGEIAGYSASNTAIGGISAYDWALGISYGRTLTSSLSLGAGVKSVGEKLDNVSAKGFAGDIGLQYHTLGFGAGLALVNVGPAVKYESSNSPLPSRIDAGVSYSPFLTDITFLAGVSAPFHGQTGLKVGIEYTYAELLILRSGYNTAENIDSRSGMSLGAGVNILSHSLDYAYNANSLFGGTHQISFGLKFGHSKDKSARLEAPQDPQKGSAAKSQDSQARKGKSVYLVCAGRYGTSADAEKYIEALKKFGYSPRLDRPAPDEYRVVLATAKSVSKAEKLKADYAKKGITCFIEEE